VARSNTDWSSAARRPWWCCTAGTCEPAWHWARRSFNDGSVPFAHAQSLTDAIAQATLVESRADSHFVSLGPDWPAIADIIRASLGLERQAT
jgi:hypothetical protein